MTADVTADVIRVSMTVVEALVGLGVAFCLGFGLGLWSAL